MNHHPPGFRRATSAISNCIKNSLGCTTGINDTGSNLSTGVVDTGGKLRPRVVDTSGQSFHEIYLGPVDTSGQQR